MFRKLTILGLFVLMLYPSREPIGQSRGFPGNKEVRIYTIDLQPIDKLELLKLKKEGDLWRGEIESTKTVEGADAQKIVTLWRTQTYRSYSAICHFPGYAIKFYSKGKLIVFATLCWECNNIGFVTPRINDTQGFEGKDKKGKALLEVFRAAFADKK